MKVYSKFKMIAPKDTSEEELKWEFLKNSEFVKDRKKILQGTMDLSFRTISLVEALKNKGLNVSALNYFPRNNKYQEEYIIDGALLQGEKNLLNYIVEAAARWICEFDIFHFHYGSSLLFNHNDVPVIQELGKKCFMHFWGREVRMNLKARQINPYYNKKEKNDEEVKRKLQKISSHISNCIVNDYEVYEYVKDQFQTVSIVNPMMDIDRYKMNYERASKEEITIVHAPSMQEEKGTAYILRAVEELMPKYKVQLKIVQDTSHEKAIEIYKEADFVIDQLVAGSYGQFSMEAMALGKPVICWISDFMKDKYPKELPIIIANPDTIKDKIEFCLRIEMDLKN